MMTDGEGESRLLRSYGRRKGKRLSPRKERLLAELLPVLRPDLARPAPKDLRDLFSVPVDDVGLEIGFGSGEYLLWQAERNPGIGFIGCEPFINGAASLLGEIETRGLQNIRVHDGDARDVLAWLPAGSIARVFILFPDPWPKKRQAKRRLVSPELAAALARVMTPGGELRFASDDQDYAGQALLAVNAGGAFEWLAGKAADWRERPADWPETRYERKALSDGRKPVYLRWRRL
jgi:tRNA (guanine-N7-)-methyltransferase